jgi:putative DNA primase/helicase
MKNDHSLMFLAALQAVFGLLDCLPVPDGNIHRFHVPGDKPGSLNGWYLLFADRNVTGCFGSRKAGGVYFGEVF